MAHYLLIKSPKEMPTWFATNCKAFLEQTYLDAVNDVKYLIEEITEDFGSEGEKAAGICAAMGLKE